MDRIGKLEINKALITASKDKFILTTGDQKIKEEKMLATSIK